MRKPEWSFDGFFFCAIGATLLVVGIIWKDLVDIVMGVLGTAIGAGIAYRGTWWPATSLLAGSALGVARHVYDFACSRFDWLSLVVLVLLSGSLVVAVIWLRMIWRHHKGMPGKA